MLFNSIEFAIFLPIVFAIYWLTNQNLRLQNLVIVAASFVFYGWWDWRFLFLLVFSASVDYFVGLGLENESAPKTRKLLLLTSIFVNLGLLGFFKYYNFFLSSFEDAFSFFGRDISGRTLNIVLPVGISFYTFQALSYSIDVYRGNLKPTKNIVAYFAFISFFPQLVAGPIERATHLLPQFYVKRKFEYAAAVDGMRQMLWGLFKKMVIADNCADYVNKVFDHYDGHSGSTLFLALILFAFQIYGDFSGYSDIAIGSARLFGFNLMRNFNFPYFSKDMAEFWRRWHISLSTWFRDYVYIPLGGSRGDTWLKVRNTLVLFLLSGFWHGANWTFLMWGFLNACYFIPLLVLNRNKSHTDIVAAGKLIPSVKEILQMSGTFVLTLFAWLFFRSASVTDAITYFSLIFNGSLFSLPVGVSIETTVALVLFILIEWFQRDKQHALQIESFNLPRALRWGIYYSLIVSIILFGGTQQEFIYFQF